jgi:nucleosome binding factor SPN SPT16 subunit
MPINGFVVAVHISLIKSVTKLDDTIRFQFHVPGKAKLSVPANAIAVEQPNTVWIKVEKKKKKKKKKKFFFYIFVFE